ncbi:MAG TPA: glutathione binding-like protein [Kofleriaceae bacterium]
MLKVFGHPASTCTRKVVFTANETNTPYELVLVDIFKGEHKSPEHVARQPFGQLPALDDDGFKMFESRAMSRYVDEKAGGMLTPKDPQARAKMEQWISVETSDFYQLIMTFIYEDVFKRPQGEEALKTAGEKVEKVVSVIDSSLKESGKDWLAGDQFSIAEVAFAPYLEYAQMTKAKPIFDKYPHFSAWWKRVSDRPAWQKTRA